MCEIIVPMTPNLAYPKALGDSEITNNVFLNDADICQSAEIVVGVIHDEKGMAMVSFHLAVQDECLEMPSCRSQCLPC